MTTYQTPYGTVDAPTLQAAQKWIATKKSAAAPLPQPSQPQPQRQQGGGFLGDIWNKVSAGAGAIGGHDYLKGSAEGLKMMGRELPQEAGSFLGDVWKSINPLEGGRESAAAGGRVLGKVGDIGMFASGGLAGPSVPESRAPKMAETVEAPLAGDLAKGDAGAVDRRLTRTFRQAVRPARAGRQASEPGLKTQDQRIVTAVDRIIANRGGLKLTNDAGNPLPPGSLPQSLRQFAEAIDQTKKGIFQQYDAMAQKAGQAGIRVDLNPVVEKLRETSEAPEVRDLHPGLVHEAEDLAKRLEERVSYSPGEAQDVIENINQTLAGFWRNPTHETVSRNSLMAPVAQTLRAQLDAAIEKARGPGYQALRHQYGALRDVEKDVANSVRSQLNRAPGGLAGHFGDLAASEEFIRGVLTVNPAALARAGTIKAAQALNRYLSSPNRAVAKMFERRASGAQPMLGRPRLPMPQPGGISPMSPQGMAIPQAAGLAGMPSVPRPTGDRSMVTQ